MEKIRIKLIILGSSGKFFNVKKIIKHKSFLFEIVDKESYIEKLPNPEHKTNTLEQFYYDVQLERILQKDMENIIQIGIINCYLDNNFYVKRIFNNTAVISISYALERLQQYNITIENFILNNIYRVAMVAFEVSQKPTCNVINDLHHIDSRKCLYDMNGDIRNIIFNTERPIICSECENRISNLQISKNFIKKLNKELLRIDKNIILKIELSIQKYPLFSLFLTIIFTVFINIFSSILYKTFIETNQKQGTQQVENEGQDDH